jgi:hypothetical protein
MPGWEPDATSTCQAEKHLLDTGSVKRYFLVALLVGSAGAMAHCTTETGTSPCLCAFKKRGKLWF